jgi:acetyltransferase-like isoleucine patch superfamily enzyme
LTLVMKGESIPAHSVCAGAPAQPVRAATSAGLRADAAGSASDRAGPALVSA